MLPDDLSAVATGDDEIRVIATGPDDDSLIISILHGSGICNDYNQKKCPGKIQGTTCENMNFGSPILATMTFDEPTGE